METTIAASIAGATVAQRLSADAAALYHKSDNRGKIALCDAAQEILVVVKECGGGKFNRRLRLARRLLYTFRQNKTRSW
jgi:hypothetical protein